MLSANEISKSAREINRDLDVLERIILTSEQRNNFDSSTTTSHIIDTASFSVKYTIAGILGTISGLSIILAQHLFVRRW